MRQITLNIPDKKFNFFMELIRSLDFVKKVKADDEPTKEQILQDLFDSVEEVNLIKAGKLKGIPAKDLIHEL
jgi:hypothetical protein